ncbi:MAG: [acyl-carrier-protein] S-malonyltransferase [Kordia sp.]|nr:MAG: [acyl-carrier-protein] S-malonyltransferase [Kordia sp.]
MKSYALIFPGQGAQYVGMGKELFDRFESVKTLFKKANEILGFDLQKLCFEGPISELTKTVNTQPAILTCSIAAYYALLEGNETLPSYTAGHSLGEFSALVIAGVLTFEDALRIVRKRGELMQEAISNGTGAMAAIANLDKDSIISICNELSTETEFVVPSNYNSPKQIVISGSENLVKKACKKCSDKGAMAIPLKVSAPFHSPYMENAAEGLRKEIAKYNLGEFKCPVISNVTGEPYSNKNEVTEMLVSQMINAVQWHKTIDFITDNGIEEFVELGPNTILKRLIKTCNKDVKTWSSDDNMDEIISKFSSNNNRDMNRNKVISKCISIAVSTKNRNFDKNEYQQGVIDNYNKLNDLNQNIEDNKLEATDAQMNTAMGWLQDILNTKKTPKSEKQSRIKELMTDTGTVEFFSETVK